MKNLAWITLLASSAVLAAPAQMPSGIEVYRELLEINTTQSVGDTYVAAQAMAEIPAKRFGTPAELGQTCAFLCSVHAGYITGQNILLDGGAYPAAF